MAEYFDVMRGFLEQQRAVVESWQAPVDRTRSRCSAPAASADLPFLGEIVEHDEHRLVARCHLSLRTTTSCATTCFPGRVSETTPSCSGLACVPLMVSVEIMAEACSLLAGQHRRCR